MKVWLDDVRLPWKHGRLGWEHVKTAQEAIDLLATGKVTEISLDHDLADEHYFGNFDSRTGYAVVLWLENEVRNNPAFKMPIVHVHSMNPTGKAHMLRGLAAIKEYLEGADR